MYNRKNISIMKNKKLIILIVIPLLLASIGLGYFLIKNNQKTSQLPTTSEELQTIDYGPSKPSDKVQQNSKDEIINKSVSPQGSETTETPMSTSITNASQLDKTIRIRTLVEGSTSGTCIVRFEKQGATTIEREAPYQPQASYVICQGFNIPVSDFPSSGQWSVLLTAKSNDGRQATASTSIEVKK